MSKGEEEFDIENLDWLVERRAQNQLTLLKLFKSMNAHADRLRKYRSLPHLGIILGAVSFSLWRAAFLEDWNTEDAQQMSHVLSFMNTLIADNTISYASEKRSR